MTQDGIAPARSCRLSPKLSLDTPPHTLPPAELALGLGLPLRRSSCGELGRSRAFVFGAPCKTTQAFGDQLEAVDVLGTHAALNAVWSALRSASAWEAIS
jgi:hypothetical protein